MIARFLDLRESIVLEKNMDKLQAVIKDFPNHWANFWKDKISLPDGKPILWFRKDNKNEIILCYPFVDTSRREDGTFFVTYVGLYASCLNGKGRIGKQLEGCLGTDGLDDIEGSKKSSDFARRTIRKISSLPDYESMSAELRKAAMIYKRQKENN